MYQNSEAKLSRTVNVSNDAIDAVSVMAKIWEVDRDHAADRMLIVSLGRLRALEKYNKAQKKEAKEKTAKKAARKAAAPKTPKVKKADKPAPKPAPAAS